MRNHTGIRPWQLSGPTGQRATWAANGNCRFNFGDIPDLTNSNLCNHLLGILVTAVCQIGATDVRTHAADVDTWLTWLFESVEVRNVWHGTPVSQNHAKGCVLGLMEFLACGYQYFGRRMSVLEFNSGNLGSHYVKVNVFIPLCYLMGQKGHHSALPVTFYRNGELQLNFGAGSADKPAEGDPTLLAATIMASAIMLPESEIHVGAGNCFVDYPATVSAGSESVKMDSFGNSTSLQGIEAGAGVDFLGWLSSQYNQGAQFAGPARVADLRRVGIPFRGVQSTIHLEPFLAGFEAAIGGHDYGQSDPFDGTAMDVVVGPVEGFPYRHNYAGPLIADCVTGDEIRNMLLFPLIYPGRDLEMTKIATYEGTQSYFLTFAAGTAPLVGTHHSFAHQFHSWTPAAWDDALRVVANSGLAQAVLGRSTGLGWTPKFSKKNADPQKIDPAKLRYLAQKVSLLSA